MFVALYGVVLGGLLALLGLATYAWAPRVGPNPWFGFRTGATFANREVWDWGNRAGGLLMVVIGLTLAVAGIGVGLAQTPTAAGILGLSVGLVLALIVGVVWLVRATHRRAAGLYVAIESRPIRITWLHLLPFALYLLLTVTSLLGYILLAPDEIAVHFSASGEPDGWMSREMAMLAPSLVALLPILLFGGLLLAVRLSPSLFAWPQSMVPNFTPERLFSVLGIVFTLVQLLVIYVLVDIIWYAEYGRHPLNPLILTLLILIVAPLGTPVALLLLFRSGGRRPSPPSSAV